MKMFSGLGTAMVTPFYQDGAVDYESYAALVSRQADAGVDFLVALGTTAETPCLLDEEKVKIIEETRRVYDGKLIAGVGTNSLHGTLHNISLLEGKGIDAWLVVTPYYNKPTQEGLYRYFKTIAESTSTPLVLYNVPGRTGVNMEPETVARLSHIPGIVGIKEANTVASHCRRIKDSVSDDFSVLCGNDDKWEMMAEGGYDGLISVVSNIIPVEMVKLGEYITSKDYNRARRLDEKLHPIFEACFVESNPIPVKGALSLMGLCGSTMRLPLTAASDSTLSILRKVML